MNFDPNSIMPAIKRTLADVKTNFKFRPEAIMPAFRSSAENVMDYKGRMSRKEFWHFSLAYLSILFILAFLTILPYIGALIYIVGSLILSIIYLTASIRRLHDSNVSGIYLLAAFVPIIGCLFVLYLFLQPSDELSNYYGETTSFHF